MAVRISSGICTCHEGDYLDLSSSKVRSQMLSSILRNFALTASRLGLKELKC